MARTKPARPAAYILKRLANCRQAMKRHGISAYLITNRADQIYLTGFDGEDGACVIRPNDVQVITDGRFTQTLALQAPWTRPHIRRNGLLPALADCLHKLRVRSVHFQADHLTVDGQAALRRAARPARLVAAPPLVGELRQIKDAQELRCMRRAIKVAEAAFQAVRRQLRIGFTETEVAARLEYEMRRRGATGPSFSTIVAEGPNASLPHAHPGRRVIRAGSAVLIDWGARVDHYCSDLTRMIFVGTIPPRLKRLYEIVLEAQERAIAAVAPGRRMCEIDSVARDHIQRSGYGPQFSHGLGHGLGLDIHEAPRVRPGVTALLKPGMVVTIEPGIYVPGLGGIRIEDDVLVTSRGHEVLTGVRKTIQSAVL
jgi:Xaa-Pro aminopeptidase